MKHCKLRGKIKEKYGAQSRFAESVHQSERTVSLKLCGKISFNQTDMIEWSKALCIEKKDIHLYFLD